VLSGIFEGMWMPFEVSWGGLSARLAGSYEEELGLALSALIAERPPVIIDAGSAEGYYAVGLARALPASTVYAFDSSREARRICRLAATRNGVHNLHVHGRIRRRQLRTLLVPNALVVSDVEGYETVLLDPERIPGLRKAAIIVEFHEWIVPNSTAHILNRFAATHNIKLIDSQRRDAFGRKQLSHLTAEEAHSAVQEGRPHGQQWAVMRPVQSV
jgi:precorrin-6B methylase 2